jgi:1-deoxy-D-xylulose-5-phosphate synthase
VKGPAAVRYPRGVGPGTPLVQQMSALPLGRGEVRRQGRSGLALIAVGSMVAPAQKIAERLDATLVNLRFIKPMDEDLVLDIATRHSAIVTLEENVVAGGAGSAIGELLASQDIQLSLLHIGIPDRFIEHGSREDCLALAGLDTASLTATIERWWARHSATRARSVGAL